MYWTEIKLKYEQSVIFHACIVIFELEVGQNATKRKWSNQTNFNFLRYIQCISNNRNNVNTDVQGCQGQHCMITTAFFHFFFFIFFILLYFLACLLAWFYWLVYFNFYSNFEFNFYSQKEYWSPQYWSLKIWFEFFIPNGIVLRHWVVIVIFFTISFCKVTWLSDNLPLNEFSWDFHSAFIHD